MRLDQFKVSSLGWVVHKRSIHWLCWDIVCKSRDEGGLGVKVEIMKATLISK